MGADETADETRSLFESMKRRKLLLGPFSKKDGSLEKDTMFGM